MVTAVAGGQAATAVVTVAMAMAAMLQAVIPREAPKATAATALPVWEAPTSVTINTSI